MQVFSTGPVCLDGPRQQERKPNYRTQTRVKQMIRLFVRSRLGRLTTLNQSEIARRVGRSREQVCRVWQAALLDLAGEGYVFWRGHASGRTSAGGRSPNGKPVYVGARAASCSSPYAQSAAGRSRRFRLVAGCPQRAPARRPTSGTVTFSRVQSPNGAEKIQSPHGRSPGKERLRRAAAAQARRDLASTSWDNMRAPACLPLIQRAYAWAFERRYSSVQLRKALDWALHEAHAAVTLAEPGSRPVGPALVPWLIRQRLAPQEPSFRQATAAPAPVAASPTAEEIALGVAELRRLLGLDGHPETAPDRRDPGILCCRLMTQQAQSPRAGCP